MRFITEFLQQPDKINMETISKMQMGKLHLETWNNLQSYTASYLL